MSIVAQPLRFNPATFEVILNAATIISLEAELIFQDKREPFENLLLELTSTQMTFKLGEMGDIIKAKMAIREALGDCSPFDQLELSPNEHISAREETSASVHEDKPPRAPVLGGKFSSVRRNDAAFPPSSSNTVQTDDSSWSFALTRYLRDKGDFEFDQSVAECKFLPWSLM